MYENCVRHSCKLNADKFFEDKGQRDNPLTPFFKGDFKNSVYQIVPEKNLRERDPSKSPLVKGARGL